MHFFVGVNGAFVEDADGNVTGLDTDDAIGFSVTGASLDLIIVKEGGTGTAQLDGHRGERERDGRARPARAPSSWKSSTSRCATTARRPT